MIFFIILHDQWLRTPHRDTFCLALPTACSVSINHPAIKMSRSPILLEKLRLMTVVTPGTAAGRLTTEPRSEFNFLHLIPQLQWSLPFEHP